MLVALYNPAVTPSIADLAPEQRADAALEVLRTMFGAPNPEEVLTTDWTGTPMRAAPTATSRSAPS